MKLTAGAKYDSSFTTGFWKPKESCLASLFIIHFVSVSIYAVYRLCVCMCECARAYGGTIPVHTYLEAGGGCCLSSLVTLYHTVSQSLSESEAVHLG